METKKCTDCAHWGWDPDGHYCAHSDVLKTAPYGTILDVARGAAYIRDSVLDDRRLKPHFSLCGPEARLFVERVAAPKPSRYGTRPVEPEQAICGHCAKPVSFDCRAHFVADLIAWRTATGCDTPEEAQSAREAEELVATTTRECAPIMHARDAELARLRELKAAVLAWWCGDEVVSACPTLVPATPRMEAAIDACKEKESESK